MNTHNTPYSLLPPTCRCHDRGACFSPGNCSCRNGFKGSGCEASNRDLPTHLGDRGSRTCLNKWVVRGVVLKELSTT